MLRLSLAVTAIAISAPAFAQMSGDATRGAELAESWCSSCHLVSAEGVARDTAPPFHSIAIAPDLSDEGIRAWLIDPHGNMPLVDLSEDEMRDIIAYMRTLRSE
jgi:mono/diheme cytochrome c family protein